VQTRLHSYTSESVSMGHPDKVADRISDAVLDCVLKADKNARVACEALVTGRHIVLAGEISGSGIPDETALERVARDTVAAIGYDSWDKGFHSEEAQFHSFIQPQSLDIARGVNGRENGELGAGDQGLMFGHATVQTPELMPLAILLAHRIVTRQAQARTDGLIPDLRPDAKSQVTVLYDRHNPVAVDSVLLSTQHGPSWNDHCTELAAAAIEHILKPSLDRWWHDDVSVLVNPTGRFESGGPGADTGLTGRKIIVDTYGGWARHGGGSFSGKDATKVDRSASYMARYVAKNVIAAGFAEECEIRLSYAIGVPQPTSVTVDCHGTQKIDEAAIEDAVKEVFPLTPSGIIADLGLLQPIYEPTSYHGHFGRTPGEAGEGTFSWERTDRVDALRSVAGSPHDSP
jgi:S-adenosylmethionine synthetase